MTKYLDKVSKLLAQAERASTAAEAEAFMAKAQSLATAMQIDLAIARAHTEKREARAVPIRTEFKIGERGQRLLFTYVNLYCAIARANDVQCDVAHNSTYVYPIGFAEDIDLVNSLFISLSMQMVSACNEFLATDDWRSDQVWSNRVYDFVPVSKITARRSFQESFASRVGTRLSIARLDAIEKASESGAGSGMELVLANKGLEVADAYKSLSQARGSYRGGARSSVGASMAYAAGWAAANSARLGAARKEIAS